MFLVVSDSEILICLGCFKHQNTIKKETCAEKDVERWRLGDCTLDDFSQLDIWLTTHNI